jgi:hypothetical protein
MADIEQIKINLTLKKLSGTLDSYEDIKDLPIDDELRTFVCSINSECAYFYAKYVDKGPHDDTRKAACKSPEDATYYALVVDSCSHKETRESAYRDPDWKKQYLGKWGSCRFGE